jgi:hypothetical protein
LNRPPLSRRDVLLSVAASAGMLLCNGATSAGQSVRSSMSPANTPLIPRRVLFAGADRSVVRISPD